MPCLFFFIQTKLISALVLSSLTLLPTHTLTHLYKHLGVVQCFLSYLLLAVEPLHWSSEGLSGLLNTTSSVAVDGGGTRSLSHPHFPDGSGI